MPSSQSKVSTQAYCCIESARAVPGEVAKAASSRRRTTHAIDFLDSMTYNGPGASQQKRDSLDLADLRRISSPIVAESKHEGQYTAWTSVVLDEL